jgi:peptidoglycan-N-acetylglucosamine deacetylase
VALSFDDGPDATLTPRLLDILGQQQVHATFFVVGSRIAYSPGLVRRAFLAGHEIGNHTFDHRRLTGLADGEIVAEIELSDEAIMSETGERPKVLRPPWGAMDARVEAALRKAGLWRQIDLWTADSLDWLDDDFFITSIIGSSVAPGSVVLMHDIHSSTIAAVPVIIANLKARGFHFSTISGLDACARGAPPAIAVALSPKNKLATDERSVRRFAQALNELRKLEGFLAHKWASQGRS